MKGRDGAKKGKQKGAQQHAEGQHGQKAHARFIEQIQRPMDRDEERQEHADGDANRRRDRQRG